MVDGAAAVQRTGAEAPEEHLVEELTVHEPEVSEPGMIELDLDGGETVLDLYERNGWGDGLPLEAPTPERVDAMLRALGPVDPDEVVAVLPPRSGEATRRTIAINAVLAGCRSEHLPVLITAVRALAHPDLNLRGVNATTHSVAPLLIVHGQAAVEGGFNSGLGAFGPGNRANATVGRALRLVLLHVAGARPGPGDASTQGGPAKYGYCVAENLDESPGRLRTQRRCRCTVGHHDPLRRGPPQRPRHGVRGARSHPRQGRRR